MPASPIDRARAVCLALPEAHEVEAWGTPTFRVRNKIFAMYADPNNHHGGGRPALWLNAAPGNQEAMMAAEPERYFKPPYVGPKGWVGVWLDKRPRWSEIAELVEDAWRRTAPKRLVTEYDAE